MVNITPKRHELREHLMSAHHHLTQAQALFEQLEQSLEAIESLSRNFRLTRDMERQQARER